MPKNLTKSLAKNPALRNLIAQAGSITQTLARDNNLRSLTDYAHLGDFLIKNGVPLLNLASNDYLGLAGFHTLLFHHIYLAIGLIPIICLCAIKKPKLLWLGFGSLLSSTL